MIATEAKFRSHPGKFRISVTQCRDPDCPCADLLFILSRLPFPGSQNDRQLKISFRIDPMTWQEVEPPNRCAEENAIVDEFLRDYPESEQEEGRKWGREKARIAQLIREYRIPEQDCKDGILLSFSRLLAHPKQDASSCATWMLPFKHDGVEYLIDDLYCTNPTCKCENAHLIFLRLAKAGDCGTCSAITHFQALVSFDGHVELTDVAVGPKKAAQRVLSAFWGKHGTAELERFKKRYAWSKQIGDRSGMGRRTIPLLVRPPVTEQGEAPATRVGRNEPCPCGSGKKFKRCCAAKQLATGR